jgi:hypothetical protein
MVGRVIGVMSHALWFLPFLAVCVSMLVTLARRHVGPHRRIHPGAAFNRAAWGVGGAMRAAWQNNVPTLHIASGMLQVVHGSIQGANEAYKAQMQALRKSATVSESTHSTLPSCVARHNKTRALPLSAKSGSQHLAWLQKRLRAVCTMPEGGAGSLAACSRSGQHNRRP